MNWGQFDVLIGCYYVFANNEFACSKGQCQSKRVDFEEEC